MAELVTLGAFVAVLVGSVAAGVPTVYALLVGLALFCGCAWRSGHAPGEVLAMCWHGIRPIRRILGMLLTVGILTGLWRAAGVIPAIVAYAVPLATPSLFVLMTFLLCCLVSVITGTSFGTAATMGSICVSIASGMGVPLELAGGAALAGAFFGDRWSPISTSALLVADVTGTDFYGNLRRMARTVAVPLAVSCVAYLVAGALLPASGGSAALVGELRAAFDLSPAVLLPPVVVFALAALRVDILLVIVAGVLTSVPLCLFLQGMGVAEVMQTALLGFSAPTPGTEALAGGGVVSMLSAACIVCVTSAYAGIFEETDLLSGVEGVVSALATRVTPYAATLGVSVLASVVSCNQTLAIMMAHQLSRDLPQTAEEHALDLEDSVVLVAGLVPWSIAGGVPLASMGAPTASMALAVFIYALPIWRLATSWRRGEGR
ncbi:Na+/H+ antiporter NhaC family protein [Olsenella sp. An285]|uniref:Na+/H+ antiporter NhaC family protein n=1 Tax=Olsenella sp. An285 TaxID=1965621 RepID=UPI0013023CA9|nr:Na+/H+ antiporter NhaC family protein [Olsenella sp. An285]